ncbi:MAG: class I SAM-dependent methyltransferase [Puniceicoccales bacterium]|jgi:16S rRNA (guanine527-N7)-methyltransferase|nr:class I SAM-dependent methyltransferase [Puniceicoccales bacterium]
MDKIEPLFPEIPAERWTLLARMAALHREWNARVNLVSRKDIENLEWHHYAPSIAAVKLLGTGGIDGARVLDAGTGGGFPGLVLAALCPAAEFTLADSVGKKTAAVADIAHRLGLKNVFVRNARVETLRGPFDFVTGRAVTAPAAFLALVRRLLRRGSRHALRNGVLYWRGGPPAAQPPVTPQPPVPPEPTPAAELSLEEVLRDPWFAGKFIAHYPV